MFIRILLGTTGILTVMAGIYLLVVTIVTLTTTHRTPRVLTIVISFVFLTAFTLHGVCWLIVALTKRLWLK